MAILKPLPSSGRGKHSSSITTATSTGTSGSNGHRPRRRRTSASHDDDLDAPNRHDAAGVMTSATSANGNRSRSNDNNPTDSNSNDNSNGNRRHPDDTPYLHGVRLLDTFLAPPTATPTSSSQSSRVPAVLTAEEAAGLRQIRQLLLSAHIRENHIPSEIRPGGGTTRDGEGTDGQQGVTQYLVQEFGGLRKKPSLKKVARSVLNSLRFIQNARSAASSSRGRGGDGAVGEHIAGAEGGLFVPREWNELSLARKKYVYERLTYEKLSRWDYDVLDLTVACGDVPLLFVGWAILGAPHAQHAMARSLDLRPDGELHDGRHHKPPRRPFLCDFITEFHIPLPTLCNFLRAIESDHLPSNPYHNSTHAADTLQTLFSLLCLGGSSYASSPLELFSILCAAACHDMGHPGRNNSFQVRSKSDLAVIYNDISVLENMHAARATRLLSLAGDDDDDDGKEEHGAGDLDILARMQPTQKDAFRALFRRAILNTDMTLHFAQVAQMKARISSGIKIDRGGHPLDDDHDDHLYDGRHLEQFYQTMDGRSINMALLFLLHAADVSNPAKAGPLFTEWCERSLRELFEQGDEERRRYLLPLSPMCDRDSTNKNDSQIGYIKFIVRPTFVLLSDMIPNVVTEILPVLERNLKYWENRKKVELGLPVDEEDEEEAEEKETDVEKGGPKIIVEDATLSGDESLSMEQDVLEKAKEKSRTEDTRKPKKDLDRNSNNDDIHNTGSSKSYERKRSKDNTSKSHDKKRSTNANTHVNTKSSVERKSSQDYDSKKVERKKSKEGTGSKPLERKKSRDETAMTGSNSGGGVKASRRGSGKQTKKDTIKSKEEMMANILSKPTFDRDGSVYFS